MRRRSASEAPFFRFSSARSSRALALASASANSLERMFSREWLQAPSPSTRPSTTTSPASPPAPAPLVVLRLSCCLRFAGMKSRSNGVRRLSTSKSLMMSLKDTTPFLREAVQNSSMVITASGATSPASTPTAPSSTPITARKQYSAKMRCSSRLRMWRRCRKASVRRSAILCREMPPCCSLPDSSGWSASCRKGTLLVMSLAAVAPQSL
mmetsp:Transcript_62537/g.177590  ORF Transcript_62537/g.177590 Transcript_62537/m.177590 type:complete len:210 (-) Transcript_62537:1281-1910(-)